jgi:membrane protease YdiL (CAAX protease family)
LGGFKRLILVWAIANFGIVGLASLVAGEWYIGWQVPVVVGMWVELGLIMLPNLILPVIALRYWRLDPENRPRKSLGWQWHSWRTFLFGMAAFVIMVLVVRGTANFLGDSIPYNQPGAPQSEGGVAINSTADIIKVLGLLASLVVFVFLTVTGEETMFRGLIQTQVGKRHNAWIGVLTGALLFGLRHLPNDIFYAHLWQATSQMWLTRQIQLYLGALIFGLARHFGKSCYASAIAHGLFLCAALFGLL